MKIEQLKPGMIVYDVHSYRMGNTTLRSVGVWPVKVIEVDIPRGTVLARWNGNAAVLYRRKAWSKWRVNEPVTVRNGMGQSRLETRDERKQRLANAQRAAQ